MRHKFSLLVILFITIACNDNDVSPKLYSVSTIAGNGEANTSVSSPRSIAVSSSGDIYLAEYFLTKITPDGSVTELPKPSLAFVYGELTYYEINDLYIDKSDNIYISAQYFTSHGSEVLFINFSNPENIIGRKSIWHDGAYDNIHGLLKRSDNSIIYSSRRLGGRLMQTNPEAILNNAEGGLVNGPLIDAKFSAIKDMAYDSKGNLFIVDAGNNCIRKVSPEGIVSTFAGSNLSGYKDGVGSDAQFSNPSAIAIDKDDNIYIADTDNNCIRKISPASKVTTIAGSGVAGYKDGNGTEAQFNLPQGIAITPSGKIVVADTDNHRIRIIE